MSMFDLQSAAVNERCIDEKEELQLLQTSVEMLQSTVSALENQVCAVNANPVFFPVAASLVLFVLSIKTK